MNATILPIHTPRYNEQVSQTLFVHYIKCNMISKSSKWELGFVSRNSLYRGSLYQGLSVLMYVCFTIEEK